MVVVVLEKELLVLVVVEEVETWLFGIWLKGEKE